MWSSQKQARVPPASEEGARGAPGDTSEAGGGHSSREGSKSKAPKASAEPTLDGWDPFPALTSLMLRLLAQRYPHCLALSSSFGFVPLHRLVKILEDFKGFCA